MRPPGSSHYGAHPCQQWCMELSAELTCALSNVLHGNVLILPTGNGPQLALVGIGHPIRTTHLLHHDRQWEKLTSHVLALPRLPQLPFFCFKTGLQTFTPTLVLFFSLQSGEGHSQWAWPFTSMHEAPKLQTKSSQDVGDSGPVEEMVHPN